MEYMDTYADTAKKETLEEAGAEVELRGILRMEHSLSISGARQRVVFYAEPVDPDKPLKSVPDEESLGAKWLSLDEIREKQKIPPPEGMRGPEIMIWSSYIEKGGPIFPLSVLSSRENAPCDPAESAMVVPRGAPLALVGKE